MSVYSAISANKRKTVLIMFLFIAFFITVSYVIGKAVGYGISFAGIALIVSGLMAVYSYYYSDKFALGISGAKPAEKAEQKELYEAVENMTIASGLPMPNIYVMYEISPNAFATGRDPNHSSVCVTTGLLDRLKPVELEGVIAHELSHIKNYDTRLMGITAVLVGSIALLSNIFLRNTWFRFGERENAEERKFFALAIIASIIAPIVATLIQLAVSRRREYLADADGVLLTRYPEGLANALEKIANASATVKNATLATAHLFISSPFGNKKNRNWIINLFSTHPPIEERIRILRSM